MSVAICTHDRPDSLLRCIDTVLAQTRLPHELIVVDDGQLSEETRRTFADRCAAAKVRWIYLCKHPPGLPASRNLAVSRTTGDILQFLDDDVELHPDFFHHILRLYELDGDGILAGADGVLIDPPSAVARAFEVVYRLAGFWALRPKNVRQRPLPPALRDKRWAVPTHLLAGACMSFRRSALAGERFDERLNGYALGEDRDMSLRLYRHGRLLRARGARAMHHHDPAGRPNHYQFGRSTVLNYVHIMRRAGRTAPGDQIAILHTLSLIGWFLALCSLLKPRRYAPELLGFLTAAGELIARAIRRRG